MLEHCSIFMLDCVCISTNSALLKHLKKGIMHDSGVVTYVGVVCELTVFVKYCKRG